MTRVDIQALIDAIATGVPNTALKIRTVLNAIADGTGVRGDVKEIDVSTSYIVANFDVTGLGTGERLGWAICNGNNGTRNRNGRVAIQYDPTLYPTLGAVIGSSTSTLTKSNLPNIIIDTNTNLNVGGGDGANRQRVVADTGGVGNSISFSLGGSSAPFSLIQPSIVTLFIMKL